MEGADDGEEQQRGRSQIAGEADEEEEETIHQHLLAVERIDDEAAERPDEKGRNHVARQHDADGVLIGLKPLRQIDRQQRREQVEREEQHEIAAHHFAILPVPQAFFVFVYFHN